MDQAMASFEATNQTLLEQLNDEFTKTVLPVTVFVGVEVVLGFFGNLLVVYVFLFRYHVCNFRYFVLCLAFIDLTSTLTTMPGEIVTHLYWYIYPIAEICKAKSFFNMFTVCSEAFCLLTIAIDRYRKVCQPFGWQISPKIAIIVCLLIYTVALIFAMPVAFFWGIRYHVKSYKGVNLTIKICEKDGAYEHTKKPVQYSITMETVLSITIITMLILYVLVARTLLRKRQKERLSGKMPAEQAGSSATVGASSNITELNALSSPSENSSGNYDRHEKEIRKYKWHEMKQTQPSLSGSSGMIRQVAPSYNDNELATDESRGITTDDDPSDVTRPTRRQKDNRMKPSSVRSRKRSIKSRLRRKTLIMFVLTLTFMITTVLYLTLLSFIARSDDVLNNMSNTWKAVYFLFFRLYFINHVINPLVYGLLDPHFRMIIKKMKSK